MLNSAPSSLIKGRGLRASVIGGPSRNFAPKREEATEAWRKLHDEELHNLYCYSPDIIRVIKSKGHV
jgi:hypothetical protein